MLPETYALRDVAGTDFAATLLSTSIIIQVWQTRRAVSLLDLIEIPLQIQLHLLRREVAEVLVLERGGSGTEAHTVGMSSLSSLVFQNRRWRRDRWDGRYDRCRPAERCRTSLRFAEQVKVVRRSSAPDQRQLSPF